MEEHWKHLEEVFQLMQLHHMFAKASKCSFAMEKVEYLGHFISGKGVETDPKKIEAVAAWPVPQIVKDLRSFLGIAGYYRKFVRAYAVISRPLTDLLKKGGFVWSHESQVAFDTLKRALTSAPVLAVPDFTKQFIVETDASNSGIGVVLVQEDHPIAFISRALGPKWQKLSVYEKELLAIVFAVQKWEQYLSGQHFLIKTDQRSLKWLLQ
ncbi:putative mitochondrial protein AtMg00860 [Silene latifolia]|uniref:putative mitochondrial protein AtMg00860 n=1 Tax=Silene latifolia TaxID=37657 RepID=UPI003D775857